MTNACPSWRRFDKHFTALACSRARFSAGSSRAISHGDDADDDEEFDEGEGATCRVR
jgi:hypothetical protein